MKQNSVMLSVVMIMISIFIGPPLVGADVFMKEKQHTDSMTVMGQATQPKDIIVTTWITKDKMRRDQGDKSSIAKLDDDKLVIYHLNHQKKTYTELPMGAKDLQGATSAMVGEMKVKVTPTGESKKIGSWNCKKYLQEIDMGMMPMTSEIWASEDIKTPNADFYEKFSTALMADQPGLGGFTQAMREEMKKIKGVPVLTVTTMTMIQNTTMKSSRELLEIREDTAPAGIFDIPSGYTQQAAIQDFSGRGMPGKQKVK